MTDLITPHSRELNDIEKSFDELVKLYKKVTGSYRPLLNGERYLTDREVSELLKVSRRTLQEYRVQRAWASKWAGLVLKIHSLPAGRKIFSASIVRFMRGPCYLCISRGDEWRMGHIDFSS